MMEGIYVKSVVEAANGLSRNLGSVEQIPLGEGRVFEVDDTPVAVFRTRQSELYATQAMCPHREGPLADGIIGGTQIVCPLHAYRFDLATGKPAGNDCASLRTFPVSLDHNGDVLLSR